MSRKKGFRLQDASRAVNGLDAVKIDRTTPWGNPFRVGIDGTLDKCINKHRLLLEGYICLTSNATIEDQERHRKHVKANIHRLIGKNLACWCRGKCHGDTLLAAVEYKIQHATTVHLSRV